MNLNLSIEEICSVTGAKFIDSEHPFKQSVRNIIIDSRSPLINGRTLFVLLKGNKTTGHHFTVDFFGKGGRLVLTDQEIENSALAQLVTPNPLKALQKLAVSHRSKFNIPVIGITGSNGKTTVKEWLYHVLKDSFQVVRSPKSYNSQIGVALSVLELNESHELAIFEAGISQPGEMVYLEEMIQPTLGLFTGLGDAHNSGFNPENPEEEKRREKFLLFKNAQRTVVREGMSYSVLEHDGGEEVFTLSSSGKGNFSINDKSTSRHFNYPYSNLASAQNAGLVAIAALLIGLEEDQIQHRIKSIPSISMRLEKMNGKQGNILINDAYNLDEKSLEIGLQFLASNRDNRETVLFLAEHAKTGSAGTLLPVLGDMLVKIPVDRIVYIGSPDVANGCTFINQQFNTVGDFLNDPVAISDSVVLFTGSRSAGLERIVNYYREKKHITRLNIHLDALRKNLNVFRTRLKNETRVLAMVKAQSYGGGLLEVAQFLERENIAYFGVAYADEGVLLRQAGVKLPILVMNPEPAAFDDIIDYDLEPSIYSPEILNTFIHQLILRQQLNFPIHIKLETGMNRLGFKSEQIGDLISVINTQPEVYIKSVFSHLSVADDSNEIEFTQGQLNAFKTLSEEIKKGVGYDFIRHIANSAGAYNYPEAHFDMVRLGIGLFGLLENNPQSPLENVISLVSQVSQIKVIEPGESVGYGRTFKPDSTTQIGIVPVGYSDGLRRALGNRKWEVLIQGKKYPIVGNVCMDMCMVELGDDPVEPGDDVLIFGSENSIFDMSVLLETIPYEIISSISARVHRVYIE